ncbi:phosphatidylserine decarboxylase [Viridibacillus sp. YIM B01967]|uniref:phosphatidylserine decarboxylase n=1 Tax=Viridibacillus soli TaxID=2798301 RepID=A0ABS1H1S4_9BACL|nr:phosphatidylserine decarboxylase [Viridibacillus soli]MBK3493359.1 phosphatidylserine decarboxylase [Viridibacillus soli]
MKEKLYQKAIELTNGKWSSVLLKRFTTSTISKKIIPSYIDIYDIKTAEVSRNIQSFTSLHDFFTRKLSSEARPFDKDASVYVSPVDAKIESFGAIENNTSFFVKGKTYDLVDLLGKEEHAKTFENGQFIVFYLSPADYHRIHSPIDGKVIRQYTLGARSYPVNGTGLMYGNKPISGNYRSITELETVNGAHCDVIKVGAMFVNSIQLTNTSTTWEKGEEVGYFTFGSTVVMLFEKDCAKFLENVVKDGRVRVGEAFAHML